MSQNNETVAVLVSQTSPLGVELFSYANAFFCSKTFAHTDAGHVSENTLYIVFLLKQVTISIIFPGFPNLLGKLKNGRGRGKENPNP